MAMFHLDYPESTKFFKWNELGCLCRALGFPSGLFQSTLETVKDEIQQDEEGISLKTLQRIWDLNLMFKPLHRTFNMHTADWNTCTFTTALYLLTHRALNFQDLHNIRVAYMAYEHIDMKGMLLDKHTLLRTLKMCGRTIAPLKLMHRIKHMKGTFEEKGRIQLYEFFNLILWCDVYTSYKPEDMETSSGKEEELFRVVDFQRLLTHHDERMARNLDATYLKEEWDFGMEFLGPKELFKEPVVNTDARLAQAHYHQTKYRHLKQEIGKSQKRVYRAHAGTIRSRPVSAPDLDEYRREESALARGSTTATQVYESVQRRLHSAPSGASTSSKLDRPIIPEHRRAQTPQAVTPRDLTDVRVKMDNLNFDINTLGVRCELQVEKEMEFYIPGYMEKLANRRPEPAPVPEPEKKPLHWTSKIVNNLAYPKAAAKQSHDKSCDARYRGWQKVTNRPGTHVIITSQARPNTEHGKLYTKMEQTAMEPVQYLHPDYIIRHTPKSVLPATSTTKSAKSGDKKQTSTAPNFDFKSLKDKNDRNETKYEGQQESRKEATKPKVDLEFFHSKYLSDNPAINQTVEGKQSSALGLSAKGSENVNQGRKVLQPQAKMQSSLGSKCEPKGNQTSNEISKEDVPVPYMEHSRPKIVGVGQIGTISLLESIQESRDLEEQFVEVEIKNYMEEDKKEEEDESEVEEKENGLEDDNDDIDDAEELSKSLKLNLKRDLKSQPARKSKSQGGSLVQKRKTRSAPIVSSVMRKSPRKASSPHKIRRGVKSSGPSRCRSAGEKQGLVRQVSGISGSLADETDSNVISSSYDYYSTLSSSEQIQPFKSARGSVTSEENEGVESKDTVTTRKMLTGSGRLEGESFNKSYSRNENDEVESFYSDAMTLPSSSDLTELESPPLRRGGFHDVPNISIDLGESLGSSKKLDKRNGGLHVQFNTLEGDFRQQDGATLSPLNLRPNVITACSDRKDSYKLLTDFRDYLSNSGVTSSNKRVFSKESRDRLIGRVKSSISPDLRMMLLSENNKISIPAS